MGKLDYNQFQAYIDGLYADGVMSEQDYNDIILYILANGETEKKPRDLIQIRRGSKENLPSLAQGEIALTLDTEELFVGGLNGNINLNATNFVNVTKFGAKGDGETDDSGSFKKAITYLKSKDLNTLYIPKPKVSYLIGSTIKLPSNIKIIGENAVLQAERYTGGTGGNFPQLIFENDNFILGNKNIEINGVIFRGIWKDKTGNIFSEQTVVSSKSEESPLLNFKNVDDLTFKKCEITNHISNYQSDGDDEFVPLHIGQSKNIKIIDSSFTDSKGEGINIVDCENVYLKNFKALNSNTWSAIKFWYCENLLMEDCEIYEDVDNEWTGSTIDLYCRNAIIKDCIFVGGTSIGMDNERNEKLFKPTGVVFENCYIETKNYGIFYTPGIEYNERWGKITLKNCEIKTGVMGVRIHADEIVSENVKIITENIASSRGFWIENSDFVNIKGGYIKARTGIFLGLVNGVVFKNIKIKDTEFEMFPLGDTTAISGGSSCIFIGNTANQSIISKILKLKIDSISVINAEGNFVGTHYTDIENVMIENVIVKDSLFKSTSLGCERGFTFRFVKNLKFIDNVVYDVCINRLLEVENIEIVRNNFLTDVATPSTRIWQITDLTGVAIFKDNIADNPTHHFYVVSGYNPSYQVIENNFPPTYSSMSSTKGGTTVQRPVNPERGHQYFDTTINKPIWFNGTNWVDIENAIM